VTPEPSDRRRRASPVAFLRSYGVAIACVAALAVAVITGLDHSDSRKGFDPPKSAVASEPALPAPTAPPTGTAPRAVSAKELFAENCGACHTLTPAGTAAGIGPNLDKVKLSATLVRNQIRFGSLDAAMPANLIAGTDADLVARYVARVAGSRR